MEFSITHRVGTERTDNFLFFHFLGIFHPILAWNEATIVFFDFFSLFLELSITCRVRTERKDNFFFFLFLGLFQLILASNEATTVSFNLLNFFAILF